MEENFWHAKRICGRTIGRDRAGRTIERDGN